MQRLKDKSKKKAAEKKPFKWPVNPILLSCLLVTLALNGAWIYWSYQKYIVFEEHKKLVNISNGHAQAAVDRIKLELGQLRQLLDQYSTRPALLQAISDDQPLSTWVDNLQGALPEGSQAALVRHADAPEAQYPDFGFRFAELDMINRVKKGQVPPPEVSGRGKDSVIALVVPTQTEPEQEPKATILIRVPADMLREALSGQQSINGQYRLVQSFYNNEGKTVAQVGAGTGTTVTKQVNANWQVEYQADAAVIKQAKHHHLVLYSSWLLVLIISLSAATVLAKRTIANRAFLAEQRLAQENRGVRVATSTPGQNPALADVMKVDVAKADQNLLSGEAAGRKQPQAKAAAQQFPAHVFRAYDIRGLAGDEITPIMANHLGKALGSKVLASGSSSLLVGRDGRNSSPELCQALIDGIQSTGAGVIELGLVPSPLLYYAVATREETNNGVIVTASHNGAAYNGFKIMLDGKSLSEEGIQQLRHLMESGNFQTGNGNRQAIDVIEPYIDEILSDVALMGDVRMVIDAGNGATSEIAPLLFAEMGCDVVPLYCEFDGNFPNHDPDPSKEANLQDLIAKVKEEEADLGVAFDGDGDRIFVVSSSGQIITPDRLLMLFAKDIVSRNPGTDVVYDVKCTRQLGSLISSYGGRPIMWKTGHAHMKSKIEQTGALLGGEFSGHIFIKDRWYGFDDGMLVAARLLEIMSLRDQGLDDIFQAFPVLPATPEIRIPVPEDKKFSIIAALVSQGDFQNGTPTTVDGLRVDFAKGWGLVRASNTGAELTLRFEADTDEVLSQLQQLFKRELLKVDSSLPLDF